MKTKLRNVVLLALATASLSACVVAPPAIGFAPPRVMVLGGYGHRHAPPPPVYFGGHGGRYGGGYGGGYGGAYGGGHGHRH